MEQNNREDKVHFRFALVTDSKLCDEVDQVCNDIYKEDVKKKFDCMIHLGNVVLGNNPEKVTSRLYDQEIQKFKNCISSKKLFVTQGKTDGYRDETFVGQLMTNIISDEKWDKWTQFIHEYENTERKKEKPYYYVDFPEKGVRLVFLCSYYSQLDQEEGLYEKYLTINVEQNKWLKQVISETKRGWTVILFSHAIPKSRFEEGKDPFVYMGYSTEPTLRILQSAFDKEVHVMGWFSGAYCKDEMIKVAGINQIAIDTLVPHSNKKSEDGNLTNWYSVDVDLEKMNAQIICHGNKKNVNNSVYMIKNYAVRRNNADRE